MPEYRVCPWWFGYILANPLRRLIHDPARILAPFVRDGMTVLERGPGMGVFTLELARRVGESGRVIAMDVQPRMLAGLERRAAKAHLAKRLEARLAASESMGLERHGGEPDFVLAFAVVHEFPDAGSFFAEASAAMKTGARLLLAEPPHISASQFEAELKGAGDAPSNS